MVVLFGVERCCMFGGVEESAKNRVDKEESSLDQAK